MDIEKLSHQFEEELKDKMFLAKKECGYNPTRFHKMLAQYGGVATAKRLIENTLRTGRITDGYGTLLLCGRLDLTVEHSVCRPEYRPLYTEQEIAYCMEVINAKE